MQALASLTVALAILNAEIFALLLVERPGSQWLWRINRELFGVFGAARRLGAETLGIDYRHTIAFAAALALAALLGFLGRMRFISALSSLLGFLAIGFCVYAWVMASWGTDAASFADVLARRKDVLFLLALLATAGLGLMLSHVTYAGTVRRRRS